MKHYPGLDVSLEETAICIVDETGTACREVKVPTHPEDLARVLKDPAWRLDASGLRPDLCRSGCSRGLLKPACQWLH